MKKIAIVLSIMILIGAAIFVVMKKSPSEKFVEPDVEKGVYAGQPDDVEQPSPKFTIPVLVISLQGSPRREKMRELFKNYPGTFVFIDGIRVRNKDERLDQLKILGIEPKDGNDPYIKALGDFGCCMAHLRSYMYIVQQNFPMALVLEDDVKIDGEYVFDKLINYKHPSEWYDFTFVQNVEGWGCGAQIVTNKAARVLIANSDHVLRHPIDMAIIWNKVPDLDFGRGKTWFHQSLMAEDPNTERGKLNK
jgi:GR25 family glycosyltransferase involved in LPS biosynthesis